MRIQSNDIMKRIDSEEIIKKMSPEVRKEVSAVAERQGMSVAKFVESQLSAQLMEDDLLISSEALAASDPTVDLRVDAGRGGEVRVGGGVRIPIGRRRR